MGSRQVRSSFYKAVQKHAIQLLHKHIDAGLALPAKRRCADCGTRKYLCYDHRDYSEALTVQVVCHSCNQKRGVAVIPFFDLGSMQWVRYRETVRPMAQWRALGKAPA